MKHLPLITAFRIAIVASALCPTLSLGQSILPPLSKRLGLTPNQIVNMGIDHWIGYYSQKLSITGDRLLVPAADTYSRCHRWLNDQRAKKLSDTKRRQVAELRSALRPFLEDLSYIVIETTLEGSGTRWLLQDACLDAYSEELVKDFILGSVKPTKVTTLELIRGYEADCKENWKELADPDSLYGPRNPAKIMGAIKKIRHQVKVLEQMAERFGPKGRKWIDWGLSRLILQFEGDPDALEEWAP